LTRKDLVADPGQGIGGCRQRIGVELDVVREMARCLRVIRDAGFGRAMASVQRLARHRGLIWVFVAWAAVMVICSLGMYAAENGINQAVLSPMDALWWGITTMTTVGYGDVYPVTPERRVAASVLMLMGIALFSAVTGLFIEQDAAGSFVTDLERLDVLHARAR
jgi:voltage-gated potassium channel Kch